MNASFGAVSGVMVEVTHRVRHRHRPRSPSRGAGLGVTPSKFSGKAVPEHGVGVGEGAGDAVAVAVAVGVGDGVGVINGGSDGVGVGLDPGRGLGVAATVEVAVGVAAGVPVEVAVGVAAGVDGRPRRRLSATASESRFRLRGRKLPPGRPQCRCSVPRAMRCKGLVVASPLRPTPDSLFGARPAAVSCGLGRGRYPSQSLFEMRSAPLLSRSSRVGSANGLALPKLPGSGRSSAHDSHSPAAVASQDKPGDQDVVRRTDKGPSAHVGQLRVDCLVEIVNFHQSNTRSGNPAFYNRCIGSRAQARLNISLGTAWLAKGGRIERRVAVIADDGHEPRRTMQFQHEVSQRTGHARRSNGANHYMFRSRSRDDEAADANIIVAGLKF